MVDNLQEFELTKLLVELRTNHNENQSFQDFTILSILYKNIEQGNLDEGTLKELEEIFNGLELTDTLIHNDSLNKFAIYRITSIYEEGFAECFRWKQKNLYTTKQLFSIIRKNSIIYDVVKTNKIETIVANVIYNDNRAYFNRLDELSLNKAFKLVASDNNKLINLMIQEKSNDNEKEIYNSFAKNYKKWFDQDDTDIRLCMKLIYL